VKPSNVLLSRDGRTAKLTDLGIARVVEETATTQANVVPGSLGFHDSGLDEILVSG